MAHSRKPVHTLNNVLEQAMRMGVVCGISTVKEAVFNADYHYTPMLPYDQVIVYLNALYDEQDAWFAAGNDNHIPQHIIDEENRMSDEYFKAQEEMNHDADSGKGDSDW